MKKFYLSLVLVLVLILALGGAAGAEDDEVDSPIPVEEITLNTDSLELVAGGEVGILRATIKPANATNPKVDWSSSDEGVATVEASSDAVVTPLAPGTAVITAITEDGGLTATATVTVHPDEPTPPTGGGSFLGPLLLIGGLAVLAGSFITFRKLQAR